MKNKKFFTETLLAWNVSSNTRKMPWKGETDPYKIWISEIMLQQTRVEQGTRFYQNFIKAFPDIAALAEAPETLVFKHWQGLGYYSRCRNLISSARFIYKELDGNFPRTYKTLLALKGVGTYTASAIASFAYNLPHAVVDGNVQRVLSRFFAIDTPVDSTAGKNLYFELATALLEKNNPGVYNQAIMDFGATICKPAAPLCEICPMSVRCLAYRRGLVNALPVKEKSIIKRKRFLNYLIVEYNNKIYTRKRTTKDIWAGLYEFLLIETGRTMPLSDLVKSDEFVATFSDSKYEIRSFSNIVIQELTHQTIVGNFIDIKVFAPIDPGKEFQLVTKRELKLLPFSKFISSYLED